MTKTKWHFRLWLTRNQFSVKINTAVTNNWSVGFLLVLLLVLFPDAEKSKVITYKELWWTQVLKTVKMIHCSHDLCFSWYIFKNITSHFSCSWWTLGVVPFPSLFKQWVFNLNWTEQDSWMRGETPSWTKTSICLQFKHLLLPWLKDDTVAQLSAVSNSLDGSAVTSLHVIWMLIKRNYRVLKQLGLRSSYSSSSGSSAGLTPVRTFKLKWFKKPLKVWALAAFILARCSNCTALLSEWNWEEASFTETQETQKTSWVHACTVRAVNTGFCISKISNLYTLNPITFYCTEV